jgi:uncharacterized phiE125 gp8 family phage protein
LRVDITDDDDLIRDKIVQARTWIEESFGMCLISQTWNLFLDAFPSEDRIKVPLYPLSSVTGVYYTALGAAEATLSSSYYTVDTYAQPGKIVLNDGYAWPGDTLIIVNGVRVRFVAGYGAAASNVPRPIRDAILLLVGHWYENREAGNLGRGSLEQIPFGVESLMYSYRMRGIKV